MLVLIFNTHDYVRVESSRVDYIFLAQKLASILYFICLFGAAPVACGGSQAQGRIGVVAASLCYSHSTAGSKPCLRPTPQVTVMPHP